MRQLLHTRRHLAGLILLLLVAFAALGARPLWDPDEGRYTNVALNMLASGDFIHPMRSEEAGHWTKPPLTYWAIAGSIATFGATPWAARLPMALAFLITVGLCAALARTLAPGRAGWAALAFGTALLPALAAQIVTTDFLLTACTALALLGYVEARFGRAMSQQRWVLVMWLGLGLGFLTKGPPALLPLLAIAAFQWLTPRQLRPSIVTGSGLALFAVLALGWFAWVTWQRPDLLHYFLGEEVIERIAGHGFGRNVGALGWAKVYLPVVLLGSLPWTLALWRWLRAVPWTYKPAVLRVWAMDPARAPDLLLALWFGLPFVVLCAASSRLPLYVLPLFVPIALMVARSPGAPLRRVGLLAVWVAALIGLRLHVATVPTDADASAWARDVATRVAGPINEVVFVDDVPRYGLHLYLGAEIESVMLGDDDAEAIGAGMDHALRRELGEREPDIVYLTPEARWPVVQDFIEARGQIAVAQGSPMRGRVLFIVRPAAALPRPRVPTPPAAPLPAERPWPLRANW